MNKTKTNAPVVGGSSLITVFAVLCLAVFTLLNLSTVFSARDLAETSVQAVKGYYEADSEAELIFAKLRSGTVPEEVTVNGNFYSYVCPISETQSIEVEVSCIAGEWNVIKWLSVSSIQ